MSNFAADKQNTGVNKYIFPILLLWVMLPLKAQEYLTNVDDRVAKLTGRVDSLEAKIDKILKAVTK